MKTNREFKTKNAMMGLLLTCLGLVALGCSGDTGANPSPTPSGGNAAMEIVIDSRLYSWDVGLQAEVIYDEFGSQLQLMAFESLTPGANGLSIWTKPEEGTRVINQVNTLVSLWLDGDYLEFNPFLEPGSITITSLDDEWVEGSMECQVQGGTSGTTRNLEVAFSLPVYEVEEVVE